jgi:hypothetical protein
MNNFFKMVNQHGFVHPVSFFSNVIKIFEAGRLVEQTLLYEM